MLFLTLLSAVLTLKRLLFQDWFCATMTDFDKPIFMNFNHFLVIYFPMFTSPHLLPISLSLHIHIIVSAGCLKFLEKIVFHLFFLMRLPYLMITLSSSHDEPDYFFLLLSSCLVPYNLEFSVKWISISFLVYTTEENLL